MEVVHVELAVSAAAAAAEGGGDVGCKSGLTLCDLVMQDEL
jgi:hypothetical protein